jgi:hypothetical protein
MKLIGTPTTFENKKGFDEPFTKGSVIIDGS